jgi:calcineurin-like phosphoesterase family protein
MNRWFGSDFHLFHKTSFVEGGPRNKFETPEQMNDYILNNLFEIVKSGDRIYFGGDIGWKFPQGFLQKFFDDLKKHRISFVWVEGNHDKTNVNSSCIIWKGQIYDTIIGKQPITVSHYPMYVWNKSHYGAWNLYGHIHYKDATWNKLENGLHDIKGKSFNINIELNNFKLYHYDEISALMDARENNFDLITKKE